MRTTNKHTRRIFACDFETTVYENQERTDVWASCLCELGSTEPILHGSIGATYDYFESLNEDIDCYYHNLKFDGNFWLSYLLIDLNYKQAYYTVDESHNEYFFLEEKDMPRHSVKYLISKMGQWYTITIRLNNGCYVRIKDSVKLFPFRLEEVAQGFKTEHKKLSMEYEGFRYPNCPISDTEKEYILNDVLVLKEALEIFFLDNPKNKLTIGSCCLAEFRKDFLDEADFRSFFPNLKDIAIDPNIYKYDNAETYIRKSYRGGWCYVVPERANEIIGKGLTADVNSLYPSMMSSESGNYYPIGLPMFWSGDYIPDGALQHQRYYFVRIKTRFYVKPNHLPFIQIKHSLRFRATEILKSSDFYDIHTGKYYDHYMERGELKDTRVELTLTMTDFQLLKDHYDLVDFEILDGCYFNSAIGIFDRYIEKYKKQKLESKGAKRTEAKLFLNNLYGKFATSDDSTFKIAYVSEDKVIKFFDCVEHAKPVLYIPVGSAITSYARNFTIRTAQKNYHGADKHGFIYADTDSIHCDLTPEELIDVPVHDKNFCCWKLESYWDKAIFVRAKTYIEHVTHEDGEPIDEPYNNIKCAGMPSNCKDLLNYSLNNITEKDIATIEAKRKKPFTEEEKEFITHPRTFKDFKIGLTVPSKLIPRRIKGGVLLMPTTFKMKNTL